MSAPSAPCPPPELVLARIDSGQFYARPLSYREQVCAWLRANGIDPAVIPANPDSDDVLVVLVDEPAIARTEYVLDDQGRKQLDHRRDLVVTRRVHSLLRVPLPTHLDDGTDR